MKTVYSCLRGMFQLAVLTVWLVSEPGTVQGAEGEPVSDSATVHIGNLLGEGVHPRLRWGDFSTLRVSLQQLYGQNATQPLWIKDGRPTRQALAIIDSIAQADDKGLNSADYDVELLRNWAASSNWNPRETAAFDVALSVSALRYVSNLYLGRINPRNVDFGLNIERKRVDLPDLVQKIAQSEKPGELVDALEPDFPLYQSLKAALVRYRRLAAELPTPRYSFPSKFSPGAQNKDVPALRRLLAALGDLPELQPAAADSTIYDHALAEAVKSFQQRHGLATDGVIGNGTLNQLNYPLTDRVEQIQLGLERLRWLPQHISGTYIMVNIPSFQLFGFRDGSALGVHDIQMNVIVGAAVNGRHTPVFYADMTYVNFRPYWNVPYKITAKELLPAIARNPGYLARNNLEIVSSFAPSASAYAPTSDNIQMLATGTLKLRQKPGPKNALGLVKFAFPNNNNVYLHSTPSRGLFKRARRDFSHGCIRVEDPVALAEFVLAGQGGEWAHDRIEAAMNGKHMKTVTLKQSIPVYLFYSTVLADREGRTFFFDDIYGHDLTLQNLLAKGFPYPP